MFIFFLALLVALMLFYIPIVIGIIKFFDWRTKRSQKDKGFWVANRSKRRKR